MQTLHFLVEAISSTFRAIGFALIEAISERYNQLLGPPLKIRLLVKVFSFGDATVATRIKNIANAERHRSVSFEHIC